jgi:cysteine desulfurase
MIYLDNAATTPVDPKVLSAMLPYFSKNFANPASVHTPGQISLKAVDDARYTIANILNVSGNEIIFTSGATESNNLALKGLALKTKNQKNIHIITTAIEHSSILETCAYLESKDVSVSYIKVDSKGLVTPNSVINSITPDTRLISIGYVNSETGVIQPIKKIGRLLKKYNEQQKKVWLNTQTRKRGPKPEPILFHTDATQALQFFNCQPNFLHVDLMSLSAHKIYGPKGVGILYSRLNTQLTPQLHGGHQERNIRSGTVNVPAVVGFAKAMKITVQEITKSTKKISELKNYLYTKISHSIPGSTLNSPFSETSPSHLNISFPDIEGDLLQAKLDEQGIAVSTGSACASGDITTSHVLEAMGRNKSLSQGAIRFSISKNNVKAEMDKVVSICAQTLQKLQKNRT